ncbi:hypothetical protein GGI25_003075 [Coemansia spiralis]|uniref:Uncharacterized protein n=2 Tax=Coemansia TaxID=4863 RepID=A0A9W8KWV6_9FUNG|nr:2',3'-cyclic-nucleotide 3'-phosphodiesterase [Coemansia spiralis]KAJ1994577.1 hypothetical protein EDC05_001494 [Coemansia umbellata]KAJ2624383.1 hypothetical protein GGI26_001518 [Coemansia sp. RSA 1358]KAJ2677555.1 hypothetical protein GGI25_003075 [Coemansia spiralis]
MSQGKYSLWVCPSKNTQAQDLLNKVISHFSKSLDAPYFQPHATLFSPIRAESDDSALAQVRNYVVRLHAELGADTLHIGIPVKAHKLATGDKFHQCIFLEEQGNAVLISANAIARQHWNAEVQPIFYPHVSLVYGNYLKNKQDDIAAEIRVMLPSDIEQLSFFASEIHVVETSGPSEGWRHIGSIPLTIQA